MKSDICKTSRSRNPLWRWQRSLLWRRLETARIGMQVVLTAAAWITATVASQLLTVGSVAATEVEKPNIVVILADDLGFGDVGCYNPDSSIPTPNLDRLARNGMRFTDAHSPSTVCTPTRYSLLTGRMAFRTGMRGVFTGAGGPNLIEASRLTLASMLQRTGYYTALIGKWHVGLTFLDRDGKPIHENGAEAIGRIDFDRAIPDSPIHRGFDQFFGTACCPTTDWLYAFIDGDRVPTPPASRLDRSTLPNHLWSFDCRPGWIAPGFEMEEIDLQFLEKSQDFIREHARQRKDQPFFLFHSTQAVHLPSFPGKEFQGKTKSGAHGDFIFELDYVVGQLLKSLEENGFAENTLVFFSSDNGPEVGSVVAMRREYRHDGARPWRGVKRDQWEGGHRVPTIVSWPGHVEPGSVSRQTICLTDLMATFASIVGADLPDDAGEDSFDISPIFGGNELPVRDYTLHQTISLDKAIRRGPWKYLDHKGSGGNNYAKNQKLKPYVLPERAPDAPGQLYNLDEDPGETNNLYFEHPELVKELKAMLDQTVASGRSAPER